MQAAASVNPELKFRERFDLGKNACTEITEIKSPPK